MKRYECRHGLCGNRISCLCLPANSRKVSGLMVHMNTLAGLRPLDLDRIWLHVTYITLYRCPASSTDLGEVIPTPIAERYLHNPHVFLLQKLGRYILEVVHYDCRQELCIMTEHKGLGFCKTTRAKMRVFDDNHSFVSISTTSRVVPQPDVPRMSDRGPGWIP